MRRMIIVLIVMIVLLVILGVLLIIQSQQVLGSLRSFKVESILIVNSASNSTIDGFVYVASDSAQQTQGFQGVTNFGECNGLATNSTKCIGMMFVFPADQQICLWMHNTQMPLQQGWISANGTVTYTYQAHPETDFTVCHSARYVLETNSTLMIEAGDRVYQYST